MRKLFTILGVMFAFSSSFAEMKSVEAVSEADRSKNHYHLITFKCEFDKQSGPESTPQSPPLDVDDPGTPGCNQWEINVIADGNLSSEQKNWELPLLDLNYGIGDNLQLKYEVPYVTQQSSDGKASALGETRAGIKYMFYEDEEADTQIAVYPQLSLVSPDHSALGKGIATTGSIITLPLLYTKKIGQTSLGNVNITANLGYNFSNKSETSNFISAALGIAVPVHQRIAWMGELSSEQGMGTLSTEIRQELVKINTGFIGSISRRLLVFASAGHSLYTSDPAGHNYVLAGLRLATKNVQE